jgi:CO/xanthine dehydrogenase Mo-binding subunit
VRLHTTLLGGGFGRRLGSDGIAAAVVTAQAVKKPVKFFWRREDEFGQGWYRPAQAARLEAALDAEGRVTGLRVRTAGPSLSNSFSPQGLPAGQLDGSSVQTIRESRYKPDAFHVEWVRVDQPVPMAPWRAVGATQNGFFMECFIDEVARAAKRDPYQLRRELLAHDARALNVIDTVAKAAGWEQPLPKGPCARHGLRGELRFAVRAGGGGVAARRAAVRAPRGLRARLRLDRAARRRALAGRGRHRAGSVGRDGRGGGHRQRAAPKELQLRHLSATAHHAVAGAHRDDHHRVGRGDGRRRRAAPAADRARGGERARVALTGQPIRELPLSRHTFA